LVFRTRLEGERFGRNSAKSAIRRILFFGVARIFVKKSPIPDRDEERPDRYFLCA